MELYADVTGRDIVMSKTVDAVLLGTAMTAASAGGLYSDLFEAGKAMHSAGEMLRPNLDRRGGYDRDYRRFMAMQRHREELESL
ncbi:ribulokinase [compost metagenome]